MSKDGFVFVGAMIIVMSIIIVPIIISTSNREQWLKEHNCKLIHQNPDETSFEYDPALKMMTQKIHPGEKFYECDNGVWK